MYIEPSTNIRLLSGVPLDNTYVNTLYFVDKHLQKEYFESLTKKNMSFGGYTYQRVDNGKCRISVKADDIYDCNYMMFQNESYGSKWFYAFITGITYVNNAVTEISYEIDVMQTWLFDYELKQCFVEREHSLTDKIGDNIVPENLATGEYVYSDYEPLFNMSDMCVIIAVVDTEDNIVNGQLYDGIYSGTTLYAFNSNDVTSINNKIGEYYQKPDSIVSMYMCPKFLIPTVNDGGIRLTYGASGVRNIRSKAKIQGSENFGGYVPRNKKLYTYPYNYFNLDNASGNSLPLRYEFFDDLTPVISVEGVITQPVKIIGRPCSYKGVKSYSELGGYTQLNTESLTLDCYPMCSWNTDTYATWLAQNSVPIALSTVSSAVGMGGSFANTAISATHSKHSNEVMDRNAINLGTNVVGAVCNVLSSMYSASIMADTCRGTVNNGGVNVANHRQQFYSSRVHISEEFAVMIDNYFTMYGYAVNKVKVPNIKHRPYWNYVKTKGCNIVGKLPSDDIRRICAIFDNGITFWKSGANVGSYSMDNSPS